MPGVGDHLRLKAAAARRRGFSPEQVFEVTAVTGTSVEARSGPVDLFGGFVALSAGAEEWEAVEIAPEPDARPTPESKPSRPSGRIARAPHQFCPTCGSELAVGIISAFAKSKAKDDHRTCPDCPRSQRGQRQARDGGRGPAAT